MNEIMYKLPRFVKLNLGNIQTILTPSKRKAIKNIDALYTDEFDILNTIEFKHNLKKYFTASSWNEKEISTFATQLYTDKITLINKGRINKNTPYIIVVVKDEADKLINFFNHYNKLGDFNYIFIDNGSTDETISLIKEYGGYIYQCFEKFTTHRKLAWINKVYQTIPNGSWTILLDADELLVYEGYESIPLTDVLYKLDSTNINLAGAVMIDMFSTTPSPANDYINNYIYFENNMHEEKSIFCNSVYGGIREREFKTSKYDFKCGRSFLIKKHPVIKKDSKTLLIHCHYIYPFTRNYKSNIYFGLLHYKLFDKEIEKYKRIAAEESYGNGSSEYKSYLNKFSKMSYQEIFRISDSTIKYNGTESLLKIECLKKII